MTELDEAKAWARNSGDWLLSALEASEASAKQAHKMEMLADKDQHEAENRASRAEARCRELEALIGKMKEALTDSLEWIPAEEPVFFYVGEAIRLAEKMDALQPEIDTVGAIPK